MFSLQDEYPASSVDLVGALFAALSTSGSIRDQLFATSVSAWIHFEAQMGRLKNPDMPQKGIGNLKKSLQAALWSPMVSKGAFQGTH